MPQVLNFFFEAFFTEEGCFNVKATGYDDNLGLEIYDLEILVL